MKKVSRSKLLLKSFVNSLVENTELVLDLTEAFLLSCGSTKQLARNVGMIDEKYYSAMQGLERSGCIEKAENNQFLITPKGLKVVRRLSVDERIRVGWKGKWCLVIFDIPETKRKSRDMFRNRLKWLGFIVLQKSVMIAPSADLTEIAQIRDELGIAKYVTVLEVEVSKKEIADALKKKFNL